MVTVLVHCIYYGSTSCDLYGIFLNMIICQPWGTYSDILASNLKLMAPSYFLDVIVIHCAPNTVGWYIMMLAYIVHVGDILFTWRLNGWSFVARWYFVYMKAWSDNFVSRWYFFTTVLDSWNVSQLPTQIGKITVFYIYDVHDFSGVASYWHVPTCTHFLQNLEI